MFARVTHRDAKQVMTLELTEDDLVSLQDGEDVRLQTVTSEVIVSARLPGTEADADGDSNE